MTGKKSIKKENAFKKDLKEAIKRAKKGDWNWVDEVFMQTEYGITSVSLYNILEPYFNDESGDVRDLAYTKCIDIDKDKLGTKKWLGLRVKLNGGIDDPWIHARFRASVAAVKHGHYIYCAELSQNRIKATLEYIAKTEHDLEDMANEYLSKIGD